MNKAQAIQYLKENHRGVLATLKKDGRPQLSNIAYLYDAEGEIKFSTTGDSFKVRNIRRNPQVSMVAQGDNWYQYLVIEGTAAVSEEGQLAELRRIYAGITGSSHPNWPEFDEAMLRDHRVVVSIKIEKMYPLQED